MSAFMSIIFLFWVTFWCYLVGRARAAEYHNYSSNIVLSWRGSYYWIATKCDPKK